ncbi:hypothetical protein U9M48_019217 [Paspalum notatum var. saurae]|uniref:J domain-containing protein n=1 Tax=Paspalum notatum var. saurae TaxID=547442 RepID=A0AAQ3WQJ6_PASNO
MASSGKMEGPSAPAVRRDPYEVLSVPRDSSDQEIKSAYRKLALKSAERVLRTLNNSVCTLLIHATTYWAEALAAATYLLNRRPSSISNEIPYTRLYKTPPSYDHLRVFGCLCYPNLQATAKHKLAPRSTACVFLGYPPLIRGIAVWISPHEKLSYLVMYHPDKNASNPEASELFKEVAYSYSILSDPEKRRQYDTAGFEALENDGMDMEIDLSNLGTMNTMFAALFSKLGVPIKTTISPTVLEEAMNGTVTVRPLPIGTSATGKVDKQCAHFFGVTISEEQAHSGIVVRVTSPAQSKFKLLYFEQEINGGYGLALQEDSQKTGKMTSAGMYFLHFQVYRMDSTVNALAMAKDPEAAFFKRLEGLQPCEVSALRPGTHIFAVYGDNFFKPASYIIEAMCAKSYKDTTERLKEIESKILAKRNDLRQFETEYRKALARFQEVTNRYTQEREAV